MPVDLSTVGRPHAYPRRMRFWPWALTWLICNVSGAVIVMLAWPKDEPVRGLEFWSWLVGAVNALFLVLLGFGRAGYEALWYRARWLNHHRDRSLSQKVRFAQRQLHVLGVGYCLPLGGKSLSDLLAGKRPVLKAQAPRHGSGKVFCNRFEDNDPVLAVASCSSEGASREDEIAVLANDMPVIQMIRGAFEPLVGDIRALTRYEKAYWPQVRVLAEPEFADLRLSQVRDALRLAGLPPLDVQIVPAADSLLVADAWLDARECRPLLVTAAAWYDDDIDEGLAEGCVALLLDPGHFRLPPAVRSKAVLHRPIAGDIAEPEHGFANAAIWGDADPATVTRAWISRSVNKLDSALLAAGFLKASDDTAQCRLDRIVGDLCAASGLLAVAAAVESVSGDGAQLVVVGPQSAILQVLPEDQTASTHVDTQK